MSAIVHFCSQCGAYASKREALPAVCVPYSKRVYRASIRIKVLDSGTTILIADNVSSFDAHGGVADGGRRA
jgi:hypothetical protein